MKVLDPCTDRTSFKIVRYKTFELCRACKGAVWVPNLDFSLDGTFGTPNYTVTLVSCPWCGGSGIDPQQQSEQILTGTM